ncbi:hypothetical protein MPSEU_000883800 [Mayamaea pseudoterrestris]|nr:hypothetical protein MPSEU_000883800 [Mayamaea pseudoterrestris]
MSAASGSHRELTMDLNNMINPSSTAAPIRLEDPRTSAAAAGSRTTTITSQEVHDQTEAADEILTLSLRARPSVRWDDSVVDNEGLGRKTSKRCCIFHKERSFGESSTDSSGSSDHEYDSDNSSGSSAASGDDAGKKPKSSKSRKIARPKKKEQVPDYQRFHA